MAELFQELEKIGFSVNEAKVYLALIRTGSSLAGRLAKEANTDRSSTYNALKQLIERGIVSTVFENKRTIYVPADPKKIIDFFLEKEELATRLIPTLKTHYEVSKERKNITLFQGYKGLKTIFQDILDSVPAGKEYYVMGSEGHFREKMPYYAPAFERRKLEKKIHTKILIRQGRIRKSAASRTVYRRVPSDVVSPATINIYGGKVAIFVWDEKPEAILIENERVSDTLKNYFEFMWKHAKK